MNIFIIGAGDVGSYLAEMLCEQDHDITVIESDETLAKKIDEVLDIRVINANGCSAHILKEANISEANYVFAMTSDDNANLIACTIAKSFGAKHTIARIRHQTFNDSKIYNYQLHLGVDELINPEALCAIELIKRIRNPGRVAVESFARGEIEVQQIQVSPDSKYANKSLREIKIDSSVRIGYVQKGEILQVPTPSTIVQPDDTVTIVGPSDVLFKVKTEFNPKGSKETLTITLFGGTETANVLTRLMAKSRFKVRIIEKNEKTCINLANEYPDANIIHGDGTSLRLLEEEQIGTSDFFIACTRDDEDNIMTGIQAKRLGAKHLQLVINKPDYEHVLHDIKDSLGIEAAVSPRNATVRELLRYLSTERYNVLAKLPGGNIIIVESLVSTNCDFAGQQLKRIPWPAHCVIIGLLHKFRAKVPGAEDKILAGDRLVAILHQESINKFLDIIH